MAEMVLILYFIIFYRCSSKRQGPEIQLGEVIISQKSQVRTTSVQTCCDTFETAGVGELYATGLLGIEGNDFARLPTSSTRIFPGFFQPCLGCLLQAECQGSVLFFAGFKTLQIQDTELSCKTGGSVLLFLFADDMIC